MRYVKKGLVAVVMYLLVAISCYLSGVLISYVGELNPEASNPLTWGWELRVLYLLTTLVGGIPVGVISWISVLDK